MSADPQARIGTRIAGKWTLESVLGSGGMATVYRARHDIGRVHALKLLHPEVASVPDVVARFKQEARAVNTFRHPGAVQIHDFDVDEDGTPFMVMELCEGETLGDASERRALPIEEVLDVTDQLLDVLAAAHLAGIVHRDIKPDNLLVSAGKLKVLDFGIARIRDAAHTAHRPQTRAGQRIGTVYYMSPEQIHGLPVDGRADLFAVGATMFWLLAGRTLHDGDTLVELIVKMGKLPAPRLATVLDAPDGLCAVVDRALAFNRAHRYPDARCMQRDVVALREGRKPPYATERRLAGDDPSTRGIGPASDVGGVAVEATMPAIHLAQSSPELERVGAAQVEARLLGTTLADKYELIALLGRGGMGAVYEAVDQEGQRYAVKVIVSEYQNNPAARRRFQREASAVSEVNNPHVVGAVEVGEDAATGLPFIVMELLSGFDLEHVLTTRGALEPSVVARLGMQACRGLGAAHAADIVHRDVKPANLFISGDDGDEDASATLRVCDFGLAKSRLGDDARRSKLTATGSMLGTPLYASPEQLTDAKSVDHRADIWGVCLSLYEALCGEPPWSDCTTQGQLVVAIRTTDIGRLDERAPWIDPALADVVHRGLERRPEQRWQSMDALEAALAPFATTSDTLCWRDIASVRSRDPHAAAVAVDRASTTSDADHALSMTSAASQRASPSSRHDHVPRVAEAAPATPTDSSPPLGRSRWPVLAVAGTAVVALAVGGATLFDQDRTDTAIGAARSAASTPPATSVTAQREATSSSPPAPTASARPEPSRPTRASSSSPAGGRPQPGQPHPGPPQPALPLSAAVPPKLPVAPVTVPPAPAATILPAGKDF